MRISTEELAGGVTRVVLEGRLDIEGAAAIDLQMNVLAGSAKALLLDMQKVTFLGSMGLRSIVIPAQAVYRRRGRFVLFAPTPMVEEVLKASSIDQLIPIYHDLGAAAAEFQ